MSDAFNEKREIKTEIPETSGRGTRVAVRSDRITEECAGGCSEGADMVGPTTSDNTDRDGLERVDRTRITTGQSG